MKKYFVIGGGVLQLDFITKLKGLGYEVHVFDYDPNCVGKDVADKFYELSIDDKDAILEIAKKEKPVAIHTVATEQGNISASYVGEKLGLLSNGHQAALATTDKAIMKKVFADNDINTPKSVAYHESDKIDIDLIEFPCMVKASDRSAGRGIQLVENKEEFTSALEDAYKSSFNKVVLIEEYFDAPQYSVETVSFNGNHKVAAITKMSFTGPPYFVEHVHSLPANISSSLEQKIKEFTFKVLDAFKVQVGACHVEIRVKGDEIKIIEIATRMGGWRHWMIESALDYNFLEAIANSTVGEPYLKEFATDGKIAISRHIVDKEEMEIYLRIKEEHPQLIVADHVRMTDGEFTSQNLIEARGFYIICATKGELDAVFKSGEFVGY